MSIHKQKKTILISDPYFSISNFYQYKKIKKMFKIKQNLTGKTLDRRKLKRLFISKNIIGVIAGLELYDEKLLNKIQNLRVISRVGVGLDSINLQKCKQKKIKILKLNNELSMSVAELSLTFILNSLRNVIDNNNLLKKNKWNPIIGKNLSNKTVGLIGYGKIGKILRKYLKIFDCNFLVFEKKKIKQSLKFKKTSLKEIFKKCDIISLNIDLNKSTHFLINKKNLNISKKDLILINTSRGAIINEKDLFNFLQKNKKAKAFLDCFINEPYKGNLLKLNNCYMTPHIATFTTETRNKMELACSKKLINFLRK